MKTEAQQYILIQIDKNIKGSMEKEEEYPIIEEEGAGEQEKGASNVLMSYGDLIILQVESTGGYLSSTGFTNQNVYVQRDNFDSPVFCRNTRDFVFQIQPKMTFDARKDYRQAQKFYQANVVASQGGSGEESKAGVPAAKKPVESAQQVPGKTNRGDQEKQTYQKKLQALRKKMQEEEDGNRRLVGRRKGENVTYGQEIQLFHIDSEQYLCAKKNCAVIEKTCNQVELQEIPTPGIYFKINPRYKYRQEGEKIKYGDQIIFLNIKVNLYLHVAEQQIPLERPLPLPRIDGQTITPVKLGRRGPPINYVPTHEVNVSTRFSRFQAVPYCIHHDDEKHKIRGGSIIRLKHSELGGMLCSDNVEFSNQGFPEAFLWVFRGKQDDVENFNTSTLFELELAQASQKGQICRDSDSKDFNHLYRLRHLNTGKLVTVQDIFFEGQKLTTLALSDHIELQEIKGGKNYQIASDEVKRQAMNQNTLFRLTSTNKDDDPTINNFSCVNIQHCASGLYVSMRNKAIFTLKEEEDHRDDDPTDTGGDSGGEFKGKLYQPLADEDVNNAHRHVIELKVQAGHEDSFFIQLLEPEMLKDILFIHTSIGLLRRTIPHICSGIGEIPKDVFNQMINIMKKLDEFAKCEDKQAAGGNEDDESGGAEFDLNSIQELTVKRQKLLREMQMCEHIVQILYYPFATGTYNLLDLTQDDQITQICQIAYELLKSSVGGYELNEQYASQWINFFFSQAMKTGKINDINAFSTVEELLSDNTKLLTTQITPSIINQFIELCKRQEKDKKLIMLLTALCTCYGEAVEHNQGHIVKFLLEDKDTREKLLMPIRIKDNRMIEVKIEGTAYISLAMLEDFSKSRDGGRIYKYFKAMIDLCANLNIGRNHQAYEQLSGIFSFDAVYTVVKDGGLAFDMRSAFLKLMNAMHLDQDPVEELEIPTATVVMQEIPRFQELVPSAFEINYRIKSSAGNIQRYMLQLKDFVLDFLRVEHGVQDMGNKKKNRFVTNMIDSLHFMLKHGFYRDQAELNALSMPLIMLLDGTDDLIEAEDETVEVLPTDRYKYTSKNETILQSKKVQCDCLIFMSQLEVDARAELILSKLKQDYERSLMLEQTIGKRDQNGKIIKFDAGDDIPQMAPGDISSLEQMKGHSHGLLDALQGKHEEKQEFNQTNFEFLDTVANMRGFEGEIGDVYICILFDLLLYQYPELNQAAFSLLIRFFNRKATLLEAINQVHVLETTKSIEILTRVHEYEELLKTYQGNAEKFMNGDDKESRETKIRIGEIFSFLTRYCTQHERSHEAFSPFQESTLSPTTQRTMAPGETLMDHHHKKPVDDHQPEKLEDLLLKLKDEDYVKDNLKPDADNVLSPEQEEFIMYLESTEPENKENQRILRSFGMHHFALYFIRYHTDEKEALSLEHVAFMKQCYRFLIKFVRVNVQNQSILREYLDYFLRDMSKHSLAIQLVYEIFKDNKKFLNLNTSKFLKQIVNTAEKVSMSNSRKGSLFQLLTAFCRYKDKLVRANQQDVVVFIADKGKQSNVLYLFNSLDGFKDIQKNLEKQLKVYFPEELNQMRAASDILKGVEAKLENPSMIVTTETINIISFVELLSLCCQGKSDVAEQKCQMEILTLENAARIIKACQYFWPMKRCFVDYVWQCFLDSNNKLIFTGKNENNIDHAWSIAEYVLDDLIKITASLSQDVANEVYIKYPFKESVSLRSESMRYATDSGMQYFKYIMKRKDLPMDETMLTTFAKTIVDFYYACKDPDYKKHAYNIIGYMYSKVQYSKYIEKLKHPHIGLHPGSLPTNENDKEADAPKRQETSLIENNESSRLQALIKQLQGSEEVQDMTEKEFGELIFWVTNIEDRSTDIVKQDHRYKPDAFQNLTFNSIVQALLQMLDRKELPKQYHLIGLQIIRKIIEVENKDLVTPAADWDTDDYIAYKDEIEMRQAQMIDNGIIEFLCKHISEVEDNDILEQCMLIGIAVLLGGNEPGQERFHAYVQKDEYNIVIQKLKQNLVKEFDQAKAYLVDQNAKLSMAAKTQERIALFKQKKAEKAALEEEQKLRDPEEVFQLGSHNTDGQFDETLENLMTVENNTQNDRQATDAGGEESKNKKSPEEEEHAADIEKRNSMRKVIRLLRFLQLLAEGHFTALQNHLREQRFEDGEINPKSFNFVALIASMFQIYEKNFTNCYSCDLGQQLIDTLIELIQGPCKENQRTLVTSKVIDNCRDLTQQGSHERELKFKGFIGDKYEILDGLKQKGVKLLLAIIEGPIDVEIMLSMTKCLDDFAVVFERIDIVFRKFVEDQLGLDPNKCALKDIQSSLKKESFDDEGILEAFDLYILSKTLAACNPPVKEIIDKYQDRLDVQFLEMNIGYIEILSSPDCIERVFFPIKPVCRYLSKQTRTMIMESVDRQSSQSKILGLLKTVPDLIDEMDHIEHLSRATIQVTPPRLEVLRDIANLISLAICALVLIFYEYGAYLDSQGNTKKGPVCDPRVLFAMQILGYVQLAFAIILVIGELITRGSLIMKSQWREYVEQNKQNYEKLIVSKSESRQYSWKASELSLQDARFMLMTKGPYSNTFTVDEEPGKKDFGHLILKLEYYWISLRFILGNGRVFYLLTQVLLSVLGLVDTPVFYSMQLLDIVNKFPVLQTVTRAITKNGRQLLLTASLELTLVWVFTILYFSFFYDQYFDPNIITTLDGWAGDNVCRTLFACYISDLNYGLRAGGGIGDFLGYTSYFNDEKDMFYIRMVMDMSYWMFLIAIFFNIILGIIVDTFGTLREQRDNMEEDKRNVCFICNIERQDMDKEYSEGFTYHIKKEHNLWMYVFFIIHLYTKDETEYGGTESFVMEKIEGKDISWFPLNKAICMDLETYLLPEKVKG